MNSFKISRILFTIAFSLLAFISVAQDKDAGWYFANSPFKMQQPVEPKFPLKTFSILNYGAVGDGQTLNTIAIQNTINACATAGGGRVIIPPGSWLTGPIELKSNVDLHAQRGAVILFTKDHTQFPIIKASSTSTSFVVASPIYGYDLKNIAITGEGIFDGGGDSWRPVKKEKATAAQWKQFTSTGVVSGGNLWWPSKEAMDGEEYLKSLKSKTGKPVAEDLIPARDFLRPNMLVLLNCENVLVEGITLRNSPKFGFNPISCKNLTIRYITIFNEWWAQNGDAMDISASKNVFVYKCNISAGDDGICMKSSASRGDDLGANLENVIIAGCTVYHAHGGFVIGSNTDGGMRNIFVSDCSFIGTDIGIRVKSNTGRGGPVRDIYISDIFMSDIVEAAILFDTYYEDVPAGTVKGDALNAVRDKTPQFHDFHLNRIYCNGAKTAVSIRGLPEMPVSKIFLDSVIISSRSGVEATDAADLDFKNVKIITPKEPIYDLKSVKNIHVNNGYFPASGKVLIKADASSSGIDISGTDVHGVTNAVQQDK